MGEGGQTQSRRAKVERSAGGVVIRRTEEGIRFGRMEMSYFLGIAYLEGGMVSQDPTQAVRWLQRAANLGSRTAQARLGAATAR